MAKQAMCNINSVIIQPHLIIYIYCYIIHLMKNDLFYSPTHKRYEGEDEGFSDTEEDPHIIIEKGGQTGFYDTKLKKKSNVRQPELKYKLKYISEKSTKTSLQNIIHNRQIERKSCGKSLQYKKRDLMMLNQSQNIASCMIKSKRTLIGQNLSTPSFQLLNTKGLKNYIISEGQELVFEAIRETNTHGFFRKFQNSKQKNFFNSKYNTLLRHRIKESFIMPKKQTHRTIDEKEMSSIYFDNEVQTGNLELVSRVKENQYDLYLRIDTNTHGHQNWFYFIISNNDSEKRTVTLNICNMKRDFRMIHKGQKIFIRKLLDNQEKGSRQKSWSPGGQNMRIKENYNQRIARGKIYKLSFTVHLQPKSRYEIATLPPYTYSQMLELVEQLEEKHKNIVDVDILTFSLTGLAIPILTFTNKAHKNVEKKVILISCRIHPGESVGSYVAEGIMKKLVSEKMEKDFFDKVIIKVIPIINPDGVVFGNFRTNYLGIDLNRAFLSEDEILNPEIFSLKSLGRQLKLQFNNRFLYFLDLHGHSSKKNIFSYGPDYEVSDPNFYTARLFPKVIGLNSKYFKYDSCTFKLEEHKKSTARGFFLTELEVMTYTIESSYSMYEDEEGKLQLMEVDDWKGFGIDLLKSLLLILKVVQGNKAKNAKQFHKIMNEHDNQFMKKIKNDIKKEVQKKKQTKPEEKDSEKEEDSDGQSLEEDLNEEERTEAEKKIIENCLPSYALPRVVKPTVLYPTVTPKLFEVEQKKEETYKVLFTKRNKYNNLRMANPNTVYADYLKNIEELNQLRPNVKNIKLQKMQL